MKPTTNSIQMSSTQNRCPIKQNKDLNLKIMYWEEAFELSVLQSCYRHLLDTYLNFILTILLRRENFSWKAPQTREKVGGTYFYSPHQEVFRLNTKLCIIILFAWFVFGIFSSCFCRRLVELETKILAYNPKKIPPRIRSTQETEMQISFNDFGSLLMGKQNT